MSETLAETVKKVERWKALSAVIHSGFKNPTITQNEAAAMADWVIARLAERGYALTEVDNG